MLSLSTPPTAGWIISEQEIAGTGGPHHEIRMNTGFELFNISLENREPVTLLHHTGIPPARQSIVSCSRARIIFRQQITGVVACDFKVFSLQIIAIAITCVSDSFTWRLGLVNVNLCIV